MGEQLHVLQGHTAEVWSLAFSPRDKNLLLSGSSSDTVCAWDPVRGTYLGTLHGDLGGLFSLEFVPGSGDLVASGSGDQRARLWSARTGAPWMSRAVEWGMVGLLEGHEDRVRGVATSAFDGDTVVSVSEEGQVGSNSHCVEPLHCIVNYCCCCIENFCTKRKP